MIATLLLPLLGIFFLTTSVVESQQTGKLWRIGFLSSVSAKPSAHLWNGFLAGLRDFGYIEGKNVLIEARWAEGKPDHLPSLATELVSLKVDVIVSTGGSVTAFAARNATSSIPIVFTVGGDLVMLGLVNSLAKPGGNLTGLSLLTTELNVKRMELLQETFPDARLIGLMGNPKNPNYSIQVEETKVAAKALGLQIERFEVPNAKDLDSVLLSVSKKSVRALLVLSDPILNSNRHRITSALMKLRLPAIYEFKEFTEAGGLMSYGTDIAAVYRRIGSYLDKIFKGTSPAVLPVEQPTKFELVINLKTAKQIGLVIPPQILARADRVIR